ncbi:MAG: helix-turn-helix domain-containing protein [Defluviitaleaceae bacterium]|nr:helix-turn-helix domain-containing protein [Defluviitaleaceae bacterium]
MFIDTKENLIKLFLNFSIAKDSNEELNMLIEKYKNYLSSIDDLELELILHVLNVWDAESCSKSFAECCNIASQIFHYLEHNMIWTELDIQTISSVIGYHTSVKKTLKIYKELTHMVSSDTSSVEWKVINFTIKVNMTFRLLRAKYIDSDINISELDNAFIECYDYVYIRAKNNKSPLQYVLKIRRGVYDDNYDMVSEGLDELLKTGEERLYKNIRNEIAECIAYTGNILQTPLSYLLVGHQIKKARLAANISMLELAHALDIDEKVMLSIECGEYAPTLIELRILADILHVTVGYLIGEDIEKTEMQNLYTIKVNPLISTLLEEDKNFLLDIIDLYVKNKTMSNKSDT